MSKRKKKSISKKVVTIIFVVILFILVSVGAGASDFNEATHVFANTVESIGNSIAETWTSDDKQKTEIEPKIVNGMLEMHTIDVGQGDSCLIVQGANTMLIDCGTKSKGKDVVKYLQEYGIKKIDVLIGTHPHDDHMGGMAEIINDFEIGVLYMPDNSKDNITTSWYMELLDSIENNNINLKYPEVGDTFNIGDADVQILAPNSDNYSNKNNYSIATKITYGNVSLLLTGDAEEFAEDEMINSGYNLEADIFKAGHHGSDTSNSGQFLKAINPKYVLISCKIRKHLRTSKEKYDGVITKNGDKSV